MCVCGRERRWVLTLIISYPVDRTQITQQTLTERFHVPNMLALYPCCTCFAPANYGVNGDGCGGEWRPEDFGKYLERQAAWQVWSCVGSTYGVV